MATFLTKKHLSRRAFLRGSGGVALALPFLDAMVPAATALANTEAAPKTRAGFFYIPHGAIMNNTVYGKDVDLWSSTGKGADFTLGKTLASLEPLKNYVTTFDNIENLAAGGSVHTLNPATWLSCVRPDTAAKGASMAITLDQVITQSLGQKTALPSLEVASETTIQVAACGGAGCYYASTTSYAGPHSPPPMEYNPRKVFIQLMGEGDTAAERDALLRKNASILDMVSDRAKSLSNDLGPGDRARLADYLDTVREVERRVKMASSRDFSGVGVPDPFPPVSHHSNDRERIRRLTVIQRYHMERFADFVKKLSTINEGDGSILDHSLFLYGSNMGNRNQHDNYPLPEVLVGGANGKHVGGKNLTLPARTPLANLHLTILDKVGIKQPSFGNSTGLIAEV